MLKKITDLRPGEIAVVKGFTTLEEMPIKLIEMGCISGSKVELLKKAPFKGPLYIKVNDSFLALDQTTASKVEIENYND